MVIKEIQDDNKHLGHGLVDVIEFLSSTRALTIMVAQISNYRSRLIEEIESTHTHKSNILLSVELAPSADRVTTSNTPARSQLRWDL
jgi:hypothetical protein